MQAITKRLSKLKQRRNQGVSTVITVMLSLVLIVIIVGNVFLSSYKMNQIDWEKIREDVSIVSATNFRDYATHNPSQYVLQGSTTWLSGNFAALTADDGDYMNFRSYYSGVNTADFVDNNVSNVDSVSSLGVQSNFTAQKFGPDRINDTFTEANDGTIYGYLENYVDNDNTDIDSSADIGTHSNFNNQKSSDGLFDSLSEADTGSIDGSFGHTGSAGFSYTSVYSSDMCGSLFNSPSDSGGATVNSISWYGGVYFGSGYAKAVLVTHSNMSIVAVSDAAYVGSTMMWRQCTFSSSPTLVASTDYVLMLIFSTSTWLYYSSGSANQGHYDSTNSYSYPSNPTDASHNSNEYNIYLRYTTPANYRLDLEEQITSVTYNSQQEFLCVKTGSLNAESLQLQVWNGAWNTVSIGIAASSWNNFSVASYLTSATFYFRFLDGTTSGDSSQGSWNIDAVLIQTYNTTNYRLDIEEQFTNVSTSSVYQNKELCIFAGTWTTTEALGVQVWNVSSNSWVTVIGSLTKNSWNNVSIASLLSATVTIRFLDGVATGDSVQDSWSVDVALLHLWYDEYTSEVEFTGTSNMENLSQLNWTANCAWTTGSVTVTLQLYNFALGSYSIVGDGYLNYTSSSTPNTDENLVQVINTKPNDFKDASGSWKIKIKGIKADSSGFDFKADLLELRTDGDGGTAFTFENKGALTSQLVSLWVDNSTLHQRFDISLFLNSGETVAHTFSNVFLPNGTYSLKVVTERGNIAVLSDN